jgi:hypothetical protein
MEACAALRALLAAERTEAAAADEADAAETAQVCGRRGVCATYIHTYVVTLQPSTSCAAATTTRAIHAGIDIYNYRTYVDMSSVIRLFSWSSFI